MPYKLIIKSPCVGVCAQECDEIVNIGDEINTKQFPVHRRVIICSDLSKYPIVILWKSMSYDERISESKFL